jgi:MoaA/NifB/PqqE/SkfB family radical SAM enzyme
MIMKEFNADVDKDGRLILPPEFAWQFGLNPGTKVRISNIANGLHLRQPVTHLAKVYIEPTSRCNLDCITCIRRSWNETLGEMSPAIFSKIIDDLRCFYPPPDILLGGHGEPLSHPHIVDMLRQAKAIGSSVELITNGTLLTPLLSQKLIDAGLDTLWVSLDGANPESYADVRLGAAFAEVLANLAEFRRLRWNKHYHAYNDHHLKPRLGIEFVAMKRNIKDLSAVIKIAVQLGARRFMVTNVLPYTQEMRDEILYSRSLGNSLFGFNPLSLDMPKMDMDALDDDAVHPAMLRGLPLRLAKGTLIERNDRCPFIEKGAIAIRCDGQVSPCLPLLHDHRTYLDRFERSLRHYSVGDISQQPLSEIWNNPEHLSFRERVQEFDFSPCTSCGGCNYLDTNEADCMRNPFPTCGGCLWAQGVIQCP